MAHDIDRSISETPWLDPAHDVFGALGHPVRRYLLDVLSEAEAPAGELAERVQLMFGFGWPAVSKHLHRLHDAGLVRVRRDWSTRFYRLDDEAIDRLECRVRELRRRWTWRQGAGYHLAIEPEEDRWPLKRAVRRPADENEAIDRIVLEVEARADTGSGMVG